MPETIRLDTFPKDDKYYALGFVVPKDWLIDAIERIDTFNTASDPSVDLKNFLENYIWDESILIYQLACKEGKVIIEEDVA